MPNRPLHLLLQTGLALGALLWASAGMAQLREPRCPGHTARASGPLTPAARLDLPPAPPDAAFAGGGEASGTGEAARSAGGGPPPAEGADAGRAAVAAIQGPDAGPTEAATVQRPEVGPAAAVAIQTADGGASDEGDAEPDLDEGDEAAAAPGEPQSAGEVEAAALAAEERLRRDRAEACAAPGPGSPLAARLGDALSDEVAGPPEDEAEEKAIQEEIERFATFDIGSAAHHYDIPVELNDQVEQFIRLFQGPLREHFVLWLSRAARYVPRMREILVRLGLPSDTVYLALIESGFSPLAYSHARAAGQWQFIASTGRRFGLRSDFWIDERRDPEKATVAAAAYLEELRAQLGSWYLAWAGYNAGAGTIRKAIRRQGTSDFWSLVRGRVMKRETKGYVPKLIAAALIAKHPHAFGFDDVLPQPPLVYEEVDVPPLTDLDEVARAAGVDVAAIHALNPALRRFCTPPSPGGAPWRLRVPPGTGGAVRAALAQLPPDRRLAFKYHKVLAGETLAQIAQRAGVEPAAITRMNGLRGGKLPPGRELVIPVPPTETTDPRVASLHDEREIGGRRRVWRWRHGRKHWFYARGGVSWIAADDGQDPWHPHAAVMTPIAAVSLPEGKSRGVSPAPPRPAIATARTEVQSRPARVPPPRLRPAPVPEEDGSAGRRAEADRPMHPIGEPPPADSVRYTVAEGDSLWSIANAHGVDVEQLCRWNRIRNPRRHRLYPGEELWTRNGVPRAAEAKPAVAAPAATAVAAAAPVSGRPVSYQVRDGDNLWEISRHFGVKVADIERQNHLDEDSVLQPGMTLTIVAVGP